MRTYPANAARFLWVIVLAILLVACASTSAQDTAEGAEGAGEPSRNADPAAPPEMSESPGEASEPTDAEVMYNVFAAELLGNEGDLEGAVSSYLEAAMESDDPAIAQRATRVAIAAQSWFQAAMAADRWALLAPDDMAAREAAAATMLATQDFAGAELQLEEVLKRNPDRADAWSMVTTLLQQASDPQKAYDVLTRLVDAYDGGDNGDAVFVQSQLLARTGAFAEAAELADRALEITPERVPLLTFSGRLALNLEDLDKAVERFGRAWAIEPENHDLGLAYADLLARAARADEAREVMLSMDQTADVILSRVLFEISADEPEKARAIYAEFDEFESDNPDEKAWFQGQAAEAIGETEAAIALYGSIEDEDYAVGAVVRRAELIADSGDIEAARAALAELRQIGDGQTVEQAWLSEGRLLREAGQLQEAFETLGRALEDFEYSIPIRYSHSLLAAELGNIEAAEYDLRLILEADPDNPAALNALGYTLADQTDRYAEAEELIRRAYELQPDDPSIIDSMGWVAYRQGRLEESAAYLRRAWEMDKNPEIAAHLGEVLWAMGEEVEARVVWQEGLDIDQEHQILNDTLQRLEVEL